MDRGSYVAASGGLLQFRRLEVTNNNLANINTPGFKGQLMVGDVQSFDKTLASLVSKGDHERSPGTVNSRVVTDFTPGPIKPTGNNLDVALRNPKDFFVVSTPEGLEYTRSGNFTLAADGSLVTSTGFQVQGDGGALTVQGSGASIAAGGALMAGGQEVGKLQVVRFEDTSGLERVGDSRFKLGGSAPQPAAVDPDLVEQSLEMANVSAIGSMVDLISTNRAFEMYTRSAQTMDQLNQTAINQLGKARI